MKDNVDRNVVLIPGVGTLRQLVVPPIPVSLPLVGYMRRGWILLRAVFVLFLLLSCCLAVAALMIPPGCGFVVQELILAIFGVGIAVMAAQCAALALHDFLDLRCTGAALIITSSGVVDARSGLNLKWSDVVTARPILGNGELCGVTLKVWDSNKLPSQSFFLSHAGILRNHDEAHIPTWLMTRRSYELSYAMLTLVCRDGGEILPHRGAIFGTPLR